MPFLGQDWRSPGEQWVRTSEGWERSQLWRLKLFENLNENVLARLLKLMETDDWLDHKEMKANTSHPHIMLTNRLSKEKKFAIGLSEALTRLDMCGAIKDIRRFNYVYKLLDYLVVHKFGNLSGAAQKAVSSLVEQIVLNVMKTKNNGRQVERLLEEWGLALHQSKYDHVGGAHLWQKHHNTVNNLQQTLAESTDKQNVASSNLQMSDLPDDCIRQILHRLDNHQDLISTGLTEIRTFQLTQEKIFWRNLCEFHFPHHQWSAVLRKGESMDLLPWPVLYKRLAKRFGLRDVFAEMLHLCKQCNTLYWEDHGHPCLQPNGHHTSIPISPDMCVELIIG